MNLSFSFSHVNFVPRFYGGLFFRSLYIRSHKNYSDKQLVKIEFQQEHILFI